MQSSGFKECERRNGDGSDIGFLVACLLDELFLIELIRNYYVELFCKEGERVDMLNRVANVLFATIQDSLLDEITIRLARLIDKERICGKETFTLNRFDSFADGAKTPDAFIEKLETAKSSIASAFRDIRNQRLAHLQLDPLLDGGKYSYAEMTLVNEAIDQCMAFAIEAETQFGITRKYFPNHEESKEADLLFDALDRGYNQIVPRKWWKRTSKEDC